MISGGAGRLWVWAADNDGLMGFDAEGGSRTQSTPRSRFLFSFDLVSCFALQPDGKLLVGFEQFMDSLQRYHPDGSRDLEFKADLNTPLQGIFVQSDGTIILLSGSGSTSPEIQGTNLSRLLASGEADPSFDFPLQVAGGIDSVLVLPQNKILVGGSFTSLQGQARKYLACLQSDGLWHNDFNARLDVNARVRALALQPDGKVVVGGDFTEINRTRRNRVARLYHDGSLDQSFDPGDGPNGPVTSLVVQAENKVVITGTFTQVNGLECAGWARLMGDGATEAVEGPWLSCRRHHGAFEMGWRGAVDRLITLEVSTNLVNWQIWTNVTGSASSQWLPEPPEFHAVRRYYRASLEAP